MTYTYCAEATDLTDTEIAAIVRHFSCCQVGEVDDGTFHMLMTRAGCDLGKGHAGPHAGFQASGAPMRRESRHQGDEDCAWLMWGGVVREIAWLMECPVKLGGHGCMLFDGHEGPHLHYAGEGEPPAWLRHECPNRPKPAA